MGALEHEAFQFTFNGFLKVAFQGSRVTSDAGLILVRELDERLGLENLITEHLSDSRQGLNTQFSLADLLRQSVYSRLAGYEDLNDAVRVSADPTFRLIGSPKIWGRGAALTSTLHWFETELLPKEENLVGLMAVNREVLAQAEMATRADRIVLDMDSSESPVHGAQEGSAYNGHFASVCYHPLFLFNEHGDCVAATLRPGNVHSAEGWDDLLLPEIERQQAEGPRVAFRADAAFAKPEIYDALEQRDVDYAIRMPANKTLELEIEDILFRPPGRPSSKPLVRYKSFCYQAKSWTTPRRIVAKVEHHQGELFPRVGFIVTNMARPSRAVVRFYNKRGTAEQWIKEGKQATHWTRLSCHRFRANEVRLQLSVLAYNLGNLWRRLVLPPRIKRWSLTSLQQRLVKTGGRLVKHATSAPRKQFQVVTRIAWQPSRAPARTKLKLSSGALVFRRQLSSRIVQPSRQPSSQLRRPAVTAASSTSRTNVVAVLLIFPFFSHFQWSLTPTQLCYGPDVPPLSVADRFRVRR